LAVLAAAPTLADLEGVPGRCHALHGDLAGQFAMHLAGPSRLVFSPHGATQTLADGGLDRHSVTAIEVTEITDYHGD
jgi:plasmid maintenance system killer protein